MLDVAGSWQLMVDAIRNAGRPGVVSMAISAVDIALWDLKAKHLGISVVELLGGVADAVPVYGSGGFTSYSEDRLRAQLAEWVHERGIPRVKMKIAHEAGGHVVRDLERIAAARESIGPEAELYVDANGGYTRKQAVRQAHAFRDSGVTWFEEPVSSDDLEGLHEIRGLVDCDVAAGEYGYDLAYFRRMCGAGAVDVVQADVTRCGGISEWLRIAAFAAAEGLELSGHTAPAWHLHPAGAVPNLRHLEWFHDHVRVEALLFDGVPEPCGGAVRPDRGRPGIGLELKRADAERYLVS